VKLYLSIGLIFESLLAADLYLQDLDTFLLQGIELQSNALSSGWQTHPPAANRWAAERRTPDFGPVACL